MKYAVIFFSLLSTLLAKAQGTIHSVNVNAEITTSNVIIKQSMALEPDDSAEILEMKILTFDEIELELLSIVQNDRPLSYREIVREGLKVVHIDWHQGVMRGRLELSYRLKRAEDRFHLPLFIPPYAAEGSEGDFFQMSLTIPPSQACTLIFPNSRLEGDLSGSRANYHLDLPALPSFLHIELHSDDQQPSTLVAFVDLGIMGVFALIGFIIWLYRKKLRYG